VQLFALVTGVGLVLPPTPDKDVQRERKTIFREITVLCVPRTVNLDFIMVHMRCYYYYIADVCIGVYTTLVVINHMCVFFNLKAS
jgi:hypothetical protein